MERKYQRYPVLEIDLKGILHNAKYIVDLCKTYGIQVTGVVKGTASYEDSYQKIAQQYLEAGCLSIGDSRINTIERMREKGVGAEILLIRIPMPSEVNDVVRLCDASLQSEPKTLEKMNEAAGKQNKKHKVILMMDLGDLREGFFDEEELIQTAIHVEENLNHLHLYGIGTNLGCYGAIVPDQYNLSRLVDIAQKIEHKIGRQLEVVSGGATTTLPLVFTASVPEGINHLRVGEGIVLARDLHDIWGLDLSEMRNDNYKLFAEVIEIKEKPTYPIGRIFVDAFGNTPEYKDRGIRKRALIALGKRDIGSCDSIVPKIEGITIEGGSSDHTILDITDCKEEIKIGDILEFDVLYEAMIHATNSSSVLKVHID